DIRQLRAVVRPVKPGGDLQWAAEDDGVVETLVDGEHRAQRHGLPLGRRESNLKVLDKGGNWFFEEKVWAEAKPCDPHGLGWKLSGAVELLDPLSRIEGA